MYKNLIHNSVLFLLYYFGQQHIQIPFKIKTYPLVAAYFLELDTIKSPFISLLSISTEIPQSITLD